MDKESLNTIKHIDLLSDVINRIAELKLSKNNMNSNTFQFMEVHSMDDLINNHTALESINTDPINNIKQDIYAIEHMIISIDSIEDKEKYILLELTEDIDKWLSKLSSKGEE